MLYRPLLGSALLSAGATVALTTLLVEPGVLPPLTRYRGALDAELHALMRPRHGLWIVRGQLVAMAATLGLGLVVSWLCLALLAPVCVLPLALLREQRVQRAAALEAQLDSFLLALTNSLKAIPALGAALEAVVPLAPDPIRSEFQWALRAFDLGTPLDEALTQLAGRVPSPPLATAVTILNIARRTGGDLSNALETCASSLREMARLEGVLRSKTASGKAQAVAIGVIPVPLVALLHHIDPNFLSPLGETLMGNALVVLAVALWATAIVLARWIVAVDL